MRLSSVVMDISAFFNISCRKEEEMLYTSPTSSDGFWDLAGLND
jgi:hypothetical protein